jgi:hypothetical protein
MLHDLIGYEFTHVGDRLWRKTRSGGRPILGGLFGCCKGTDPNRNWNFKWGGMRLYFHFSILSYILQCLETFTAIRINICVRAIFNIGFRLQAKEPRRISAHRFIMGQAQHLNRKCKLFRISFWPEKTK